MSNKVYDILKDIQMIAMPAIIVFYISISNLWGWSNLDQIAGTLTALNVMLGAFLKVSKTKYDKEDNTNE